MSCKPKTLSPEARPDDSRELRLLPGVSPLISQYMYPADSCNLARQHYWNEPKNQGENKNGHFLISCIGICVANNYHLAKRFMAPYLFCHKTDRTGILPKNWKIGHNPEGVHP